MCGKDISACYTKDDRISELFNFQKANPQLLLLEVEKTNDLIFLTKTEYHQKLSDLLENSKFEKLNNFNLQDELISFRNILTNSIEHCLGQSNKYLVQPKSSISSLYGKVKCHKDNWPLRLISTGYSHIVFGAETYIKTIIEPLQKKCEFLVDSQKSFKKRFLTERLKFKPDVHEIVSFDIVSMYPNVNITRVVSYILKVVFKNPKTYFTPEKDSKGYTLPIPTRDEFKLFLLATLKDFNYLDTQIGTFKQHKGLQMGNTLGPLISNLFIGCLEREVVKKLIKRRLVISWTRYADDNLVIIKKGSYDAVLTAINSWDQDTKYTGEKMVENSLQFLSCTIFIENGSIEFKTFRKAHLDTIMSNYRHSVMSKRHLNNNITTALNHSENLSSTEDLF